jgi:hypothetical protein
MEDKKDSLPVMPEQGCQNNVEHVEADLKAMVASKIHQEHSEIYLEALQRYPTDDAIDQVAERKLRRKLDMRILPLLGICYFFYVRAPVYVHSAWITAEPPVCKIVRRQDNPLLCSHLRHQG